MGLTGVYFGLAGYYSERFCYGTWINGIYCTGKTVEEVNHELIQMETYDTITVIDRNNSGYDISLEEIEYSMDYSDALSEIKDDQDSLKWIQYYGIEQTFSIMPKVIFSEEKLNELLKQADFMNTEVLAVGIDLKLYWKRTATIYMIIL